jgi:hypothetical protein
MRAAKQPRAFVANGIVAIALAAACPAARAASETIFRCGDSYSQTQCANAKAIDVGPPPSDAQRADARTVARREKDLALAMVRERQERERAIRPSMASSLGPAPAATPASAPGKKHGRSKKRAATGDDVRDFVAAVPKIKK